MSRVRLDMARMLLCFPRVSGDEPAYRERRRMVDAFSPRERG